MDFDIYLARRLIAVIKETTKDLKYDKKEEVLNSEILEKRHFGFGFSDFSPQRKSASVNIVVGGFRGLVFVSFFLYSFVIFFLYSFVICSQGMELRSEESFHVSQ